MEQRRWRRREVRSGFLLNVQKEHTFLVFGLVLGRKGVDTVSPHQSTKISAENN